MTTRYNIETNILFLLMISAVAGSIVAVNMTNKPISKTSFSIPVMQSINKQTLAPTPVITPEIETSSQLSPDGTKKLTLTAKTNADLTKTYTFSSSNITDTSLEPLYRTTLPGDVSMHIPFNTWSPDNTYVFIQQTTASESGAVVMRADGKPFQDGQQYLDVTSVFSAKDTGNTYQETTGWASETLLIMNTTQPNKEKGPSYWFEVPSKVITQLSTQF